MKHDYSIKGQVFSLRPVNNDDAKVVVTLRTDPDRGKFIHPTSTDINDQITWFKSYYLRDGDYYFAVIDQTGSVQGFISLYDVADGAAEWGRWIIKEKSLAAVESVLLILRFAFDVLGLKRAYSRVAVENHSVVSFHEGCGLEQGRLLEGYATIRGKSLNFVEYNVTLQSWSNIEKLLECKVEMVAKLTNRGI